MKQLTPQSWGRVYWGGGAGRQGEMGGWRFHCNFCTEGNVHSAFARHHAADVYLAKHVMDRHRHKTMVRVLMESTTTALQITTGAADVEAPVEGVQER